jgi:hypothetical protein
VDEQASHSATALFAMRFRSVFSKDVLPRDETHVGANLHSILEITSGCQGRDECDGGCRTDAGTDRICEASRQNK